MGEQKIIMIGIITLYFIGRYFYNIAEENNKNNWVFAILGVAIYFIGLVIGQMIIFAWYEIYSEYGIEDANETIVAIASIPIGLLFTFLLSKYLKKSWQQKTEIKHVDLLDEELREGEYFKE